MCVFSANCREKITRDDVRRSSSLVVLTNCFFFYPVLMLACSHFHSAGGRTVLIVDVMCSDGEGFSACRKKRLPGVR